MHQYSELSKMITMERLSSSHLNNKNDDYLIVTYESKMNIFWTFKLLHNSGSNECDVVFFSKKDNWVWVVYAKPCIISSKI